MENILNNIENNLSRRKGYSLIRCGDGESLLLNCLNDEDSFIKSISRRLNYTPTRRECIDMRNNLIFAISTADVIGIPDTKHFKLSESWTKTYERILEHCNITNQEFCSIDIHYHILESNSFDRLLKGRDKLFYVSGRDVREGLQKRYSIGEVQGFEITPELIFEEQKEGWIRHYPDQFYDVYEWIQTLDCRGCICLIGAGYIGKIYASWFKQKGGVCIDIGSIFDSWAGKVTRGANKGVNVIDETNKL